MADPLLEEIVIVFGLIISVLLACHRFKVPSIVGFLLTGVLSGPKGFGLINEVEFLAEMGVVMLMFSIGLERSFKELWEMRHWLLVAGTSQVAIGCVIGGVGVYGFGFSVQESIFWGFFISLSSTAIVLKMMQDSAQLNSPFGQLILAILIFQDVVFVPMMLMVPYLGGQGDFSMHSISDLVLKIVLIFFVVLLFAKKIVPKLLYAVLKTKSRELFLFTVLGVCFSIAHFTSMAGLSLGLGAFLAGLIISESEYSSRALGKVIPFKDIFTSFFFVSVGMLLDISYAFKNPVIILSSTIGVLVLKTFAGAVAGLLVGFPISSAVAAGLALSQIGEFSFVLARAGLSIGVATESSNNLFSTVSIITMAATPAMVAFSPYLGKWMMQMPLFKKFRATLPSIDIPVDLKLKNHTIIIGYGVNGSNMARSCRLAQIPYVILEVNPEIVRSEREKGEPIFFGDASQHAVLKSVDIEHAKAAALVINDFGATQKILEALREINPRLYIVVRAQRLVEAETIMASGADHVVADEFEASMEIFSKLLRKYLVPKATIDTFVTELRGEQYEMLRNLAKDKLTLVDLKKHLTDVEIETFHLSARCPIIGKKLKETGLRQSFGVTLLLIERAGKAIQNPDPDFTLQADDLIIVLGDGEHLNRLCHFLAGDSTELAGG
ncbi:MAG: sodium/hydrogen exchanger [Chlamydiales bacterium]|jgi:CPA2 family monovalent cation:H+ antiporter-2|nr:sodium/hydrogen exchanger [Chlamydiales bacterium]